MHSGSVLAAVTSRDIRIAVNAIQVPGREVEFIASARDQTSALALSTPSVVIWEMEASTQYDNGHFAAAIHSIKRAPEVICIIDLSNAAARQMLWLSEYLPTAIVCLKGYDDIAAKTALALKSDGGRSPDSVIVRRLLPLVPKGAVDILATILVAGAKRTSLETLSSIGGWSARTVQWRLRRAGLPSVHSLLGWAVALHSAWKLDVLQIPAKRLAHVTGFSSTESWASYCARHVNLRPSLWPDIGGFPGLLERCATRLAKAMLFYESGT